LLVRQLARRLKQPTLAVVPVACAVLLLATTVWLLRPVLETRDSQGLGFPTLTPTVTRVTVTRLPTPTSFIATATPKPLTHVVLEGEVLGLIAEEYGTTVEALLEANGLEDVHLLSVGLELIIVGAQRTPVLAATPSRTPTPTSIYHWRKPQLLLPLDQQVFAEDQARPVLQWASVGVLETDLWYEVRVWSPGSENVFRSWTKSCSWIVPDQLYPGPKGQVFNWDVAVVQRGNGSVQLLSERSQRRIFGWY
jgi:hypothetical protein